MDLRKQIETEIKRIFPGALAINKYSVKEYRFIVISGGEYVKMFAKVRGRELFIDTL